MLLDNVRKYRIVRSTVLQIGCAAGEYLSNSKIALKGSKAGFGCVHIDAAQILVLAPIDSWPVARHGACLPLQLCRSCLHICDGVAVLQPSLKTGYTVCVNLCGVTGAAHQASPASSSFRIIILCASRKQGPIRPL